MTNGDNLLVFLLEKKKAEQQAYQKKTGHPVYNSPGKKNGLTLQQLTFTNYYLEAA